MNTAAVSQALGESPILKTIKNLVEGNSKALEIIGGKLGLGLKRDDEGVIKLHTPEGKAIIEKAERDIASIFDRFNIKSLKISKEPEAGTLGEEQSNMQIGRYYNEDNYEDINPKQIVESLKEENPMALISRIDKEFHVSGDAVVSKQLKELRKLGMGKQFIKALIESFTRLNQEYISASR